MIEVTWFSPATGKEWAEQMPDHELPAARHEATAHGLQLVATRDVGWAEQLAQAETPEL